jgi:tetratricopeptide (TPR) repeat protein
MDTLALPGGKRVSATERRQVKEALDASIAQGWQFFHTASPTQVLLVGQGLLHLLEQTRVFLCPADYQGFYAAITNLIGAAIFFQGCYDDALQMHKRAFQAAQEGADLWNQTQSLNWQAIAANSSDRPAEAIQYIEAALHMLEGQKEPDYQRLRAHLCADWAYNASILGKQAAAHAKLDASVRLLDNLGPNEEFDLARWHQMTGDCMLLNRQYAPAISHLELSLSRLPGRWISRRILTLLPLAKAYAYQQERDMSIETAERAACAIQSIGSVMLARRLTEYLHMLVEVFPRDKIVHRFVAGSLHQFAQKSPGGC